MGISDLFITPIYIILLLFTAYALRPYVTDASTSRYFLPALILRFLGAIALGLIYQFYYGGGDTFGYTVHGSRWIWEAFINDPSKGLKLLLTTGGEHFGDTFEYSSRIWYYRDPNSYFIVRIAGFFDLFTFSTYSATALLFALFSFSGLWALFSAISRKYPDRINVAAFAILFVPSSIFWGSGILKDSITLGALAWLAFALIEMVDFRRLSFRNLAIALTACYLLYSIKVYILISFLPTIFLWVYLKNVAAIRSVLLRRLIAPFLLAIFVSLGYWLLVQVTNSTEKYQLDNIAQQAAITAYDIRYGWGARTGGDGGYDIGLPDGTWQSMIRLMPAAINVSLFRPYLWEVRNPLMLLTSLEAIMVIVLTVRVLYFGTWRKIVKDPFLVFCLIFSLLFAFAVGVSTFNFGTLMRYKIPMIPFYLMVLLIYRRNREYKA